MFDRTMKPRNGHTFHVGIVARISGCQRQKEVSLEDQVDHGKEEAQTYFDAGIPEYHIIATKGKGERLDRPELAQIETMIRSRVLDLLIVEDLGRLVRGTEAVKLLGLAVDAGVRVVAPNDCIDTADPSWEEDVISACRDHVGHNSHTSKRLKQKMMNRFRKNGASMARPIYGFIVPKDAKTYNDWLKDESATPIILELFKRYKELPNFSLLADWLNEANVPTGPYDRTKRWDSAKVRRLMSNTLLKGMARRGCRHTVKHHETGRRISVKNPVGPVYYACPHLAHVPETIWDEVNELRQINNQGLGRKPVNGEDPRAGVTRKRTVYPGQHVRCGICGRLFYWGGHGSTNKLMCSGVRDYQCWNTTSFDGHLAARQILNALMGKLEQLPEFDTALLEKLNSQAKAISESKSSGRQAAERELQEVDRKIDNVADAIAQNKLDDVLGPKLMQLKMDRLKLQQRIRDLIKSPQDETVLPPMASLKKRVREAVQTLATNSPEFGEQMKRIITNLVVLPYRICDGNRIVQRARFVITLVPFINVTGVPEEVDALVRYEMMVDLFDDPPQRVQFREQVMALHQAGMSLGDIAARLGISKVAVQNAMKLNRKMEEQGLSDPFFALREPPVDDTKMKRHLHPRYRFSPLKLEDET